MLQTLAVCVVIEYNYTDFCCRWVDVLRCCSRWELLQQIASGMPTDAVLFCPDKREDGTLRSAASAIGKGLKRLGLRDGDAGGGPSERDLRSIDQLNMNEASIRRQHIGGSNRRGDAEDKGIPQVGREGGAGLFCLRCCALRYVCFHVFPKVCLDTNSMKKGMALLSGEVTQPPAVCRLALIANAR